MSLTSYFKRKNAPSASADGDDEPFTKRTKLDLPSCTIALAHTGASFIIVPPTFSLSVRPQLVHRPIKAKDLDLLLIRPFLASPRHVFNYLLEALPWYRVTYTVRGMTVNTPRYTTVFGKDATNSVDTVYKKRPRAIPPLLESLKAEVEKVSEAAFNFVLLNYYVDGKDSISYHSDDESFLGSHPIIASISLGGSRDFYMRHKSDKSQPVQKFELRDSDLLVMRGATQECCEHSVPKRAKAAPRINLTFRKAINVRGTDNYYRYNVGDGPMFRFVNGKMLEATSLQDKKT